MEQYLIIIFVFIIGMIIGGLLHRQTMTTPESRAIDRQHNEEHIALIEKHTKELEILNKKYDAFIKH